MSREHNGRQLDSATLRCNLHRELVVRINAMAKVLYFYFSMFLEDPLHINHWKLDGEREPPVPPIAIQCKMGESEMLEVYFGDNWQFLVM